MPAVDNGDEHSPRAGEVFCRVWRCDSLDSLHHFDADRDDAVLLVVAFHGFVVVFDLESGFVRTRHCIAQKIWW